MDRVAELEVFCAVAELRSFAGAARRLGLPRSTVTARVQALERRLGVRLLHRTTRAVAPTEAGRTFAREAGRILADLELLEGEAADGAPRGRLRVDAPAALARHVLAPALPGFLDRYPDLVLHLGSSDRPVDLLAEGVDCVIRGGEVFDESLVGRRVGTLPVLTVAAPAYLARRGVPRTPEDLDAHELVGFFSPRTGRVYDPEFGRDGVFTPVPMRHRVACNDSDTWFAAVVAGLGIAQAPRSRAVADALARGEVVRILEGWDAGELAQHALWPRQRLPARVRVFVDWVAEVLAAVG